MPLYSFRVQSPLSGNWSVNAISDIIPMVFSTLRLWKTAKSHPWFGTFHGARGSGMNDIYVMSTSESGGGRGGNANGYWFQELDLLIECITIELTGLRDAGQSSTSVISLCLIAY